LKCPKCGYELKLKEVGQNYNLWLCNKCGYELLEVTCTGAKKTEEAAEDTKKLKKWLKETEAI